MPSFQECLTSAGAKSNAEEEMSLLGPPLEHPMKTIAVSRIETNAARKCFASICAANLLQIIRSY
jgi:hypothetical protein